MKLKLGNAAIEVNPVSETLNNHFINGVVDRLTQCYIDLEWKADCYVDGVQRDIERYKKTLANRVGLAQSQILNNRAFEIAVRF
jgi:hypothetical protein